MRKIFTVLFLSFAAVLTSQYAMASSSILNFMPAILSGSHSVTENSAPEAFIDLTEVKDGHITLRGHFKDDDDNDLFVSAAWVLQNDKGETIYEFSDLEVTDKEMTAKGDITVMLTVTTGTGDREKTSSSVSTKITV